jgi:hypothetical protein
VKYFLAHQLVRMVKYFPYSAWLKRYEKKVSKVMVNSSTHNKKDNHLSSQIIEHEKRP